MQIRSLIGNGGWKRYVIVGSIFCYPEESIKFNPLICKLAVNCNQSMAETAPLLLTES